VIRLCITEKYGAGLNQCPRTGINSVLKVVQQIPLTPLLKRFFNFHHQISVLVDQAEVFVESFLGARHQVELATGIQKEQGFPGGKAGQFLLQNVGTPKPVAVAAAFP